MTSKLHELKKQIPFRWKVQSARSWGCDCVAYIDARQVMDLLDQVMGPENWRDHYYSVGGSVYCEISLKIGDEWVSKSDAGSQSNFEAEKGQASDAFKRAAVKWGIGRFLYSIPSIRLKAIESGTDKYGKPKYVPADDHGTKIRDLTSWIRANKCTPDVNVKDASPNQKENIKALCQVVGWSSEQLKSYLNRSQMSWKRMTEKQAQMLFDELMSILKNTKAVRA